MAYITLRALYGGVGVAARRVYGRAETVRSGGGEIPFNHAVGPDTAVARESCVYLPTPEGAGGAAAAGAVLVVTRIYIL